ncbi:ABC transporter ATP-binding protein [Aeromicrobium phragmitis]|uniref:ABC transporter ATP-binding protein n=1 Tax=Aeromicrobium phragmitis TaxID=2478914 RepID=UPI001FB596BA|nr:ABC transporter ATP-binding protein [Aeromicrobium phragmitis]
MTSIIALHDLNLAAMFCDSILVLKRGRVIAAGEPRDVLTPPLIREVYDIEADVTVVNETGGVSVSFKRSSCYRSLPATRL